MQLALTAQSPIKISKAQHLWVLVKLRIRRVNRCCLRFSHRIKTHPSCSNTRRHLKSLRPNFCLTKRLMTRQRSRTLPIATRPRQTDQAACKLPPVSMIIIMRTILFSTARATMMLKIRVASWLSRVNRWRQLRTQYRILHLWSRSQKARPDSRSLKVLWASKLWTSRQVVKLWWTSRVVLNGPRLLVAIIWPTILEATLPSRHGAISPTRQVAMWPMRKSTVKLLQGGIVVQFSRIWLMQGQIVTKKGSKQERSFVFSTS